MSFELFLSLPCRLGLLLILTFLFVGT